MTSHHSSLKRMWILGLIFMLLVSETLGGDNLRQEYFLCLFHLTTCLTMYRTVFTPPTWTGGVGFNPLLFFVLNAVLTGHLVSLTRERGLKFSVQIRDLYCLVRKPTRLLSSDSREDKIREFQRVSKASMRLSYKRFSYPIYCR